jgi:hypothetical protein
MHTAEEGEKECVLGGIGGDGPVAGRGGCGRSKHSSGRYRWPGRERELRELALAWRDGEMRCARLERDNVCNQYPGMRAILLSYPIN